MFRWMAVLVLVAVGTFFGLKYGAEYAGINIADIGMSPTAPATDAPAVTPKPKERATPREETQPGVVVSTTAAPTVARINPIIGSDARILIINKQEVPSERDGPLLVIGTDVAPGETVPEDRRVTATIGFLIIPAKEGEVVPKDQQYLSAKGDVWRRWREGDPLEPGRVAIYKMQKTYKRLDVGDEVQAGQTVALVDPFLALNDSAIKIAAVRAAASELQASIKTKEETERRVKGMEESNRRAPGSVSKDDLEGMKLNARRYFEEEVSKGAALIKSQEELNGAQGILSRHEIRAAISGKIKVLYKNRGDAVKNLEPVMQIQDPKQVRADFLVDIQDAQRIKPGTPVIVEPTQPVPPKLVLDGHLGEVTCVAVSRGPKTVIVSGSEDLTLRGWDPVGGQQLWKMAHKSAVRSVACTGPKAKRNLALIGYADGSARLLNLDDLKAGPRELAGRHTAAVHCVAFSPDGSICATGSDDRSIALWDTATGERLHNLSQAHRAPVTSLQFTPGNQLVSAGGDKRLIVWTVEANKPPVRLTEFDRRSGDVPQLGVSPDGQRLLFDQSKEIRLLSPAGQVEGLIANPSGAGNFATMALFDPDGLTVLTNGAGEGRLQLWRTPTPEALRASELRQYIWSSDPATCGAFSPDASFCVTGTKNHHVLVWPMPERKRDASGKAQLIETPIKAAISFVEKFIDSANRQVRVFADLDNKDGRFVPGGTATMVVLPEGK